MSKHRTFSYKMLTVFLFNLIIFVIFSTQHQVRAHILRYVYK